LYIKKEKKISVPESSKGGRKTGSSILSIGMLVNCGPYQQFHKPIPIAARLFFQSMSFLISKKIHIFWQFEFSLICDIS
jgi:phosphatidylglycerophosphate synthase